MLRNHRSEIGRVSAMVVDFGAAHNLAVDDLMNINLVLDEAVINVIAHGYEDDHDHLISVSLSLDGSRARMHVEDDGVPFNILEAPPAKLDIPIEERKPGGLGVHIIKTLCESVAYRREGGRNHLTMVLRLQQEVDR